MPLIKKSGQIIKAVSSEGITIFNNTLDTEGRVIAQYRGNDLTQPFRFSYDEDSQPGKIITTATDRNGNVKKYTFSSTYQLLSVQDSQGTTLISYEYDANGNRIRETDANYHAVSYTYNSKGLAETITDPAGNVTAMTYDSNSNLLTLQNAAGQITRYAYDTGNKLTSVTDAKDNITSYTYNSAGQVLTAATPSGNIIRYEYASGLPVRITDPEGNARTFSYDAAGRVIQAADAQGNAFSYTYDESCGGSCRVNTVTDPLGNITRKSYDSRGNLLSITDPKGNITQYAYNTADSIVSVTDAMGNITRFTYDAEERLIKVTDPKGSSVQYGYDALGRRTSVTDALGNTRTMTYDAAGNLLTTSDAFGNTTVSYSYNAINLPVQVKDALNRTTAFSYDNLGRAAMIYDPLNRITSFSYDELNRLIAVTDPKGGQSSQIFDSEGSRIRFYDPNGNPTNLTYNKNGQILAQSTADGSSTQFSYNARNLLSQVTNSRFQNRQFEYDAAGRLIRMTDPDGIITYTYDANSNVLTVSESGKTITRQYDALNRVIRYTDTQNNVLQYTYDSAGNLKTLIYPDGKSVTYAYDAANRLISVTDWNARQTRYEYDANSRLVRTIRANNTVMTRTYNQAGQMIQQKDITPDGQIIAQYDYAYDSAGNITQETITPAPQSFSVMPVNMTYTSANRLSTINGDPVVFDADGNMTQGPLNGDFSDFIYDSRNRLKNAGTDVYAYDAENHRIAMNTTAYVVNPLPALSQVLIKTDSDGTKTFYVYGIGLISQEKSGTVLTYHYDLRGSTIALTNTAGQIVDRFQYSSYGLMVRHTGATTTPFLYNGRDGVMTDGNSLYYMRARYYNTDIRRFMNQDVLIGSIEDGRTLNRFGYIKGQLIVLVDPIGMSSEEDIATQVDLCINTSTIITGGYSTRNFITSADIAQGRLPLNSSGNMRGMVTNATMFKAYNFSSSVGELTGGVAWGLSVNESFVIANQKIESGEGSFNGQLMNASFSVVSESPINIIGTGTNIIDLITGTEIGERLDKLQEAAFDPVAADVLSEHAEKKMIEERTLPCRNNPRSCGMSKAEHILWTVCSAIDCPEF